MEVEEGEMGEDDAPAPAPWYVMDMLQNTHNGAFDGYCF